MPKKQLSENEQVNIEIKDHGKTWCSNDCQTFLPDEYRRARRNRSAKQIQSDYDSCHVWS